MSSKNNIGVRIAYGKGYRINSKGELVSPKGTVIEGLINNKKYRYTRIRKDTVSYMVFFHKLCAFQMFGEDAFSCDCVRHLNGNSLDNTPSNIGIGTKSQNAMDRNKEDRINQALKATAKTIKYNSDEVIRIKEFHRKTGSVKQTLKEFGISSSGTLHYILSKR